MRRAPPQNRWAALKSEIDKGMADVAAGRIKEFDPARIVERGKKPLAARNASA